MTIVPRIHTPLVVANWKMHGLNESTRSILTNIILTHDGQENVCICPPYTALRPVANALESTKIKLGAQDAHTEDKGAYTGEISAPMLANIGVEYVIVGHSERRHYAGETDELIARKAAAVHRGDMIAIVCIGESEEEYEKGETLDVLTRQLSTCLPEGCTPENTIIAYEPIWAIGTGKTPTVKEIEDVHNFIEQFCRDQLAQLEEPLLSLYGGSVKSSNARDIIAIPAVDGVLVGSASIDTEEFRSIVDLACLVGERKNKKKK